MDKVAALRSKIAQQREEINALTEYFVDLFPEEFMCSYSQFGIWTRQYGFDYAIVGFEAAAKQLSKVNQEIEEGKKGVKPWTRLNLVKYASWMMSHEKKKAETA